MRLAVIPARGGSKRIVKKNIRQFGGQPILAWSIAAALNSNCFDNVIVSTDDSEISDVAKNCGAQVPFVRPDKLSNDHASVTTTMAHAIQWYADAGQVVKTACLIYATAPFISDKDIISGLRSLEDTAADFALSVTSYAFPIQRAVRLTDSGRLAMFQPETLHTRSQDAESAWHDAGQFCWGRAEAWLEGRHWFSENCVPVFIPRYRAQDIDTLEDWERAEYMFEALANAKNQSD